MVEKFKKDAKIYIKPQYKFSNIYETLCKVVEKGTDIEISGKDVMCKVTIETIRVLRLYEYWSTVTTFKNSKKELWFRVPFAYNGQTYMYYRMKKYEVEADSIEDFLVKYGKPEKFTDIWEEKPEVKDFDIKTHKNNIKKRGFTLLSSCNHNMSSSYPVTYYEKYKKRGKQ